MRIMMRMRASLENVSESAKLRNSITKRKREREREMLASLA